MKMFDIEFDGREAGIVSARSRSAARYSFYLDMDCSQRFSDVIKFIKVRQRRSAPADDGYAYVRKAYKVPDFKIGSRCRLIKEGSMTGMEGEIVYPGRSSAHIHVALDGYKYISHVHPLSIEIIA